VTTSAAVLQGREVDVEVNAQGDVLLTPQTPPEPEPAVATADTAATAVNPAASSEGMQPDTQALSFTVTKPLPSLALGTNSNGNGNGNGKGHSNGKSHKNGTASSLSNGSGNGKMSNGNGKVSKQMASKGPNTSSNKKSKGKASSRSKSAAAAVSAAAPPAPLVLREDQFAGGAVGAKARHLAALRARLPAWVLVPASVALPFTTWDTTLAAPCNAAAAARLTGLTAQLEVAGAAGGGLPAELLASIRQLVATELVPPPGLQQVRAREGGGGCTPVMHGKCRLCPCASWLHMFDCTYIWCVCTLLFARVHILPMLHGKLPTHACMCCCRLCARRCQLQGCCWGLVLPPVQPAAVPPPHQTPLLVVTLAPGRTALPALAA
jgi:hypothetical protein